MQANVTFEKIVPEGKALGYWQGKAVFAAGPLPGEVARLEITREKANWAEGAVLALDHTAPQRHQAREAHFLQCSPWQGVDYAYQLELKRQLLTEVFGRPELGLAVQDVVAAPAAFGYRNKLEFGLTERAELALHERGRLEAAVLAPEGCVLAAAAMNRAAQQVAERLRALELGGWARSLVVRQSQTTGEIVVVVRGRRPRRADWQRLVVPGVSGVVVVVPRGRQDQLQWSYGRTALTETVGGVALAYPWEAFCQVNLPAFEPALLRIRAEVPTGSTVVDLYGGAGTIGLPLAASGAAQVLGVEITPSAVDLANANARAAGLTNYRALASRSETAEAGQLRAADVVVVDPPRAGLSATVVGRLLEARPDRIIYLSCNPVTQARDIMALQKHYLLSAVTGFDFYPGTLHVESLLTLTRR